MQVVPTVDRILTDRGCSFREIYANYLWVQHRDCSFSLRTENASWRSDARTIFIYDYEGQVETLASLLAEVKKEIQVVIYVRSEPLASLLRQRGFVITNTYVEREVVLADEARQHAESAVEIEWVDEPSTEQLAAIDSFGRTYLSFLQEDQGESLGTWFDSQYCPATFFLQKGEDDVVYALGRRNGQYVALAKLLKQVPGFAASPEIELDLLSCVGCSTSEFLASFVPTLMEHGFERLLYYEADDDDTDDDNSWSKSVEAQALVHVMECGASAVEWTPRRTNPIASETWAEKRGDGTTPRG
jgi:hypothetical protein